MNKFVLTTIFIILILIAAGVVFMFLGRSNAAPTLPNGGGIIEQDMSSPTPHPLSVDALKTRDYPGGDIAIERSVSDNSSYTSYVVSYPSDGLKLYALMNVPKRQKPAAGWPVVILNHGFIPPDTYSTVKSYSSFTDYYARQGFLVVKPDYRGHDQSEGEPTNVRQSQAYTFDVLNLVSSVKKYKETNPSAIGMWGHSMGGGITLLNLVTNGDIKAAVLWAGVVGSAEDMVLAAERKMSIPPPAWVTLGAKMLKNEFGPFDQNREAWQSISAINYVERITAPVQIHHAVNDPDVPVEFSRNLNEALKQAGKSVAYFEYPSGGHNFNGEERTLFLQRSRDFFKQDLRSTKISF